MYYTQTVFQILSGVNAVGEFVQWSFDRSTNVVSKEVDGMQKMQYPVDSIKDALQLASRQFQAM